MGWKALRIPALALGTMAALIGAGYLLTRQPGGGPGEGPGAETAGGASVERGRRLFFMRGRCSLCHQVGRVGGIRRGPVLSEGPDGPGIGARAASRALERSRATGRPYSAADYLVESLLEPGAHLVPGFRNEMPPAHLGKTGLGADEIRSVIAYLQSLGGSVNPESIRLPGDGAAETGGNAQKGD